MVAIIFPVISLVAKRNKAKYSRLTIQKGFAVFLWLMQVSGVFEFEIIGSEKLRNCKNVLVLANHPTLVDVIALVAHIPNASCVVKRELWNNFFVGGVVRSAEYISNSDPDNLIKDCVDNLKMGNPLLIFPEGTRSTPNKSLKFKRGAAHMAINSDAPIMLITINFKPLTLTKGEKWYAIPAQKAHLTIEVLETLTINHLVESRENNKITARQLTHALEQYFTEAIQRNGTITT